LAHSDQPIEDRFPVGVPRQVVARDEEVANALREIVAHDALHVVCVTAPRLAALHVDDGAETAHERATAPGIEAGAQPGGAAHDVERQKRYRGTLEPR